MRPWVKKELKHSRQKARTCKTKLEIRQSRHVAAAAAAGKRRKWRSGFAAARTQTATTEINLIFPRPAEIPFSSSARPLRISFRISCPSQWLCTVDKGVCRQRFGKPLRTQIACGGCSPASSSMPRFAAQPIGRQSSKPAPQPPKICRVASTHRINSPFAAY